MTHRWLRALGAIGATALIATSCASDAADVSEPAVTVDEVASESASDTTPPSTTPPAPTATAPPSADVESAPSAGGGNITITAAITWADDLGSFEITDGIDAIGCADGSYTEEGLATTFERVHTCESGDRTGTFTVHFSPEPNDDESAFVSEWTIVASTGDFAGLGGGGDFVGIVNDDDTGADETWTGEVEFGTPEVDDDSADDSADDVPFDGVLDAAFLMDRIERLQVPDDSGAVMVAVIDADGTPVSAAGGAGPDGATLTPSDLFRVGSITKVFTSLTVLSLVEDGLIELDDPVVDHVTRVGVPADVTVRDLLQHTSGIPSYTDGDDFFEMIMEGPARRWIPEEMVELSGDVSEPDDSFVVGEDFSYSNTNFVVLGIMIEEVTGEELHDVVRARVIDSVGMPSTYLAGAEDGPEPFGAYTTFEDQPLAPIDFDYTSIATSAWSAGAMVSSAEDLHQLFTALYDGEIISEALLTEMTDNEEYGLGIELWDEDKTLVGHGGSIPGYGVLVFHAPESGQTAFWAAASDELNWGSLVEPVVEAMVPELADDETD